MKYILALLLFAALPALAADKTGAFPKFDSGNTNQVPVLLHDNGDGTYSLSTTGGAGGGGGGGGLTNTELRATPVPISGTVTVGSITISSLPLPTGAATSAKQDSLLTAIGSPFQAGGSIGNTAFTANAGTNLNTSALALESGNLATIAAAVVVKGVLTDRSGTITTGGTAQQIAAGNATRNYLLFQNNSTETIWINFGTAAVAGQPSIKIAAGGDIIFENRFIPSGTVSVIAATTGSAFTAKEY